MNKIKTVIFLILIVFAFNKSNAQKPLDSLLVKLEKICENKSIPGAMISIVNSDSVLYSGGIGYANIQTKEPVTAQHLFRLGSISKSITALGCVKLADKDKIELDAPISKMGNELNIKVVHQM